MNQRLILALSLASSIAAAACNGSSGVLEPGTGGGGGAPACSATFTPCGGDLTGTWNFATGCNTGSMKNPNCPAATDDITATVSGSYTFNAEKTYVTHTTLRVTGTTTTPSSCLGSLSCSDLSNSSTAMGYTTNETCTGTTTCTCTYDNISNGVETGTWATAGNEITFTPEPNPAGSSAPYSLAYCVRGNQLEIAEWVGGLASSNTYSLFTK